MLRSYTRGDHIDDFQQDLLVLVESSCSDPTLEDIIQTISIRSPRFGGELMLRSYTRGDHIDDFQ